MTKNKPSKEVLQIYDRCVVDRDGFMNWLEVKQWHPEQLARGDLPLSIEEAQLLYVCEDPVLWCRAFMNEPDTGEPYTFFDYQEESIGAWYQDAIHQDGAEVGKTREITALILWGMCTGFGYQIKNPSMLIGAPQQTHLDEIIRDVMMHIGEGEGCVGSKPTINRFWRKPRKHPHWMMQFKGPTCIRNQLGLVFFRPTGHDGEAFRGVHVNAMAIMDEATKIREKVCWSEFHRAMKPGCIERIYSVPNGDNATDYYRMTQEAVPNLKAGEKGMRLFHWPKTLMPAPFWSDDRKQDMIRRYGGEDTPGYIRNVGGEHGQQENPIWPWALLEKNIRDVPEYRCIKLVANEKDDSLHVMVNAVELLVTDGKKSPRERYLTDRYDDLAPFKSSTEGREQVTALLREFIDAPPDGIYWAGADLGFSKDPTEIILSRQIGTELRDVVRIHARGVDYPMQCEFIYCLDQLFGLQTSWGVDFGNAGTAVVQMLQSMEIFEDANYEERLTGFTFSAVVDCIDEDGNVLEVEDKKGDMVALRKPAKNLATEDLMTPRFQRLGYAMPYDTDVLDHLSNHTGKEGSRHTIYDKNNDHTIDAKRAQILRKAFNELITVNDVFSSGVHRRAAA